MHRPDARLSRIGVPASYAVGVAIGIALILGAGCGQERAEPTLPGVYRIDGDALRLAISEGLGISRSEWSSDWRQDGADPEDADQMTIQRRETLRRIDAVALELVRLAKLHIEAGGRAKLENLLLPEIEGPKGAYLGTWSRDGNSGKLSFDRRNDAPLERPVVYSFQRSKDGGIEVSLGEDGKRMSVSRVRFVR